MAASSKYKVEQLPAFSNDLRDLRKRHYKKNAAGASELDTLVEELKEALGANPFSNNYGSGRRCTTESYPKGHARDDCFLRKLRFRLPKQAGGTRFGRIILEVNGSASTVLLLAVYSHDEHEENYDKSTLTDRLKQGRG